MEQKLGFAHFISQTDGVGLAVLLLLIGMSVASWYLILTRTIANFSARRRADLFLKKFWEAESLQDMEKILQCEDADNAFAELANQALTAGRDGSRHGVQKLASAGGLSEFVTRALRNALEQEAARSETGLTVLATAGSAAPYIGLFGTVWGIYHALVFIGLSGQGTLEKVAGPVGEALIMTAVGLAVAIPAVLAYNSFNRRNRIWLARLDGFAHDLYMLVTVGEKTSTDSPFEVRQNSAVQTR
ncbi:MAG TPA: MotA/TolQ/ExbB proton channel family protein [Desulfuromonadales bacterium]|nr:MotA/TolQ/ExbB proton channel family protein [Desulfuromonadales bacterium]